MTHARRHRSSFRAALATVALLGAACASDDAFDPARPDAPSGSTNDRPDYVDDIRSTLSDRRAETRDMMDTALLRSSPTARDEGSWIDGLFSWLW